jgi:uncharacterized membrane protein
MGLPRRAENPNGWLAFWVSLCVLMLWTVLFVLTGVFDDAAGWGQALSISIGTVDPFDVDGQPAVTFAVLLAITGWLLVPVLIGAVVALLVDNQLRSARPLTKGDVDKLTSEIRGRLPAQLPPLPPSPTEEDAADGQA